MKKILPFFSLYLLVNIGLMRAQSNCSTPTVVTVCSGTNSFMDETTAGAVNDRTAWKYASWSTTTNLAGNDKVYEINLPAGAQNLWIDVKANSPLYLLSTNTICNATYYSVMNIATVGCNRFSYSVYGMSKFYLWVDHSNAADITYDIHFSVITNTTVYPKGSLQPAVNCRTPIFNSKFHLTYNGVNMTYPLVYSPLGAQGEACYTVYMTNPGNGVESIKRVRFTFGNDLQNPTPSALSTPGFYATGDWVATKLAANIIEYNFVSLSGRGDYPPVGTACAGYNFCFTFTPVSNDPLYTTTKGEWSGDMFPGYTKYTGCFSTGSCNTGNSCTATLCTGYGSSSGGVAASGTFSTTDPFLPVNMISFQASQQHNHVLLSWSTASEQNSDRFEIERSANGTDFETIGTAKASGNSEQLIQYSFIDSKPAEGKQYYRLKEIDVDGTIQYSSVISVSNAHYSLIRIFPNPASNKVSVQSTSEITEVSLLDLSGNEIYAQKEINTNETTISLEQVNRGTYLMKIVTDGETKMERLVVE